MIDNMRMLYQWESTSGWWRTMLARKDKQALRSSNSVVVKKNSSLAMMESV